MKDRIVIEGKGLQALHDLRNDARQFKYAQVNCLCMARDKAKCQILAERIVTNLDEVLK